MDAGAVYRCTVIRMGSLYLAIIQLLITCSRGKLDRLVRWLAQAFAPLCEIGKGFGTIDALL